MPSELEELVDFLGSSRADVRQGAVEIVSGLTAGPEGLDQLASQSEKLLPLLFRLVGDEPSISTAALTSLVNLSQDPNLAQQLVDLKAVPRAMDYLREGTASREGFLVMLLANLTALEEAAQQLLQMGTGVTEGFNVAVLLSRFMQERSESHDHIASILTNVTRLREGRELLVSPGRGMMAAAVSQVRTGSVLRRRGCAAALRNCCAGAEEDGTLDCILAERGVLLDMLEPISGMQGPKDEDSVVREALAEAIVALAETEAGRTCLWDLKVPDMLRKGYELEEDPGVCDAMERTAQLFLSASGDVSEEDREALGPVLTTSAGIGGGGWAKAGA